MKIMFFKLTPNHEPSTVIGLCLETNNHLRNSTSMLSDSLENILSLHRLYVKYEEIMQNIQSLDSQYLNHFAPVATI